MITVNATPTASFSVTPVTAAPGTAVSFSNLTTNATNYLWNFDDPASGVADTSSLMDDTHIYATAGTYCVELIASNLSCFDTTVVCLVVADEATMVIPNVFTPNGDGNNDIFYITTTSMKELSCDIYDRWGLKIATWTSNDDSPNGWDGRTTSGVPATDGTYYYIIHAKAINGKELSAKGYLQLLKEK
jgi:gliding motility-associated-like protein